MTEPIQKKYEPSKEEIEIQKFIDENTIPATPAGGFHQDPAYTAALEGKSFRNIKINRKRKTLKYARFHSVVQIKKHSQRYDRNKKV